jgi:putative ABC transport system permease protein
MSALNDLRHAVRLLSKAPGFSAVAIATLAIGIGATTAVFSVVNAVLLRPVHAPSPDSVVRFVVTTGASSFVAGVPEFEAWRRTSAFERVSAHRLEYVNFTSGSEPQQIAVGRVTREFFDLFNASTVAGRTFAATEDRVRGPAVTVLSYEFWRQHFSDTPSAAIGQSILLGDAAQVIIGVLAPGFDTEQFDAPPAVWLPFQIDPIRVDAGNLFTVTGRLKAGVTLSGGNASLAVALAAHRQQRPGTVSARTSWSVEPLQDAMVGHIRPSLVLLLGAVGFLLLIAAANVAGLSLTRADVRAREMAIRTALGASRARIASQVLVESFLLSAVSGALGLLVGIYGVRALLAIVPSANPYRLGAIPEAIPRVGASAGAVTVDWRVFTFALITCLTTAMLFGVWPALVSARVDIAAVLKRVTTSRSQARSRAALVVGEIALALTLLVAAMLLIRSSLALGAVDAGFDPSNVITTRTAVAGTRFDTRIGLSELTRIGSEQLRSLPGVQSASATCCMPLETVWQLPFVVDGRPPDTLTRNGSLTYTGFAGWTFVSPGYFEALRVPILRGRDFTAADTATAPGVVIVNEEMAKRFWPARDPIGDRLIVGRGMRPEYNEEPVRQVIAVVGNVRDTALTRPPRPAMYVPIGQEPDGVTRLNVKLLPLVWIVRTAHDSAAMRNSIERTLTHFSGLPTARTRSMEEVMAESTARSRFNTWLMAIFGGCALLLAAIGVYGLMAYSVQQRRKEIGIRIALGADTAAVHRLVLRDGLTITFTGIALGLVASLGLTRAMTALLFEVSPRDPTVFVAVPVMLIAAALIGIAAPSHRAMRVSPIDALKAD